MAKWKWIEGYPAYEVSDGGQVRSYWTRRGMPFLAGKWRVAAVPQRTLRPGRNSGGYRVVDLRVGTGVPRTCKIATLVIEAFRGPRPVGMEVCHSNSMLTDDRLENLRYDTHSGNMADVSPAKRRTNCKLTDQQVIDIRVRCAVDGVPQVRLMEEYRMSSTAICHVCQGKSYSDLPGPRNTDKYIPSVALKRYTARTWA